jgi:flagellar hook-associated protein 1 FlgK
VFNVAVPSVLPHSDNSGTGSVSAAIQDSSALAASDYQLRFNGTSAGNESYTLTRLSDGAATAISFAAAGYPYTQTVDGVTLTISAGAALNDIWSIQPTRAGAHDIAVALQDPNKIAAASPISTAAALANRGDAGISAGSVSSAAALPLPAAVTLTYAAATGTFSVGGALPPVAAFAYASGNAISLNGIQFAISGSPADGDVFTVSPNTGGVSDSRNALVLAQLQNAKRLGGTPPTSSFQGAYSQLVSEIGSKTRQAEVMAKAQQNVIAQTRQAQQSLSGVNLDEEAANLLRYQQAYQAAGKMLQIANAVFQEVLDLGR